MELIRANYPILIQVKLESPDGLTPARSLSQGYQSIQAPAEGNGILDIPSDYAWAGYPQKLHRGYIQSWNLTVQRELPLSFTGQIGYVATRSVRQLGLVDINAGQVIGAGDEGKPLQAQFGRTASTVFVQPVGTGRYDSLQAQLQRRFVAGLSLNVNYTLGQAKSPNENSSGAAERPGAGLHGSQLALTNNDRTHNLGITQRVATPARAWTAWLKDRSVMSLHLRRLADQQHGQHHERRPVQRLSDGTSLNLPGSDQTADQLKDVQKIGGVGPDDALLRPDRVRRSHRRTVRQHRLQHPARAGPLQLGLRDPARILVHRPTSGCSSAWNRSISRTPRTSRSPTTTSPMGRIS